jgi:hypothetical protein
MTSKPSRGDRSALRGIPSEREARHPSVRRGTGWTRILVVENGSASLRRPPLDELAGSSPIDVVRVATSREAAPLLASQRFGVLLVALGFDSPERDATLDLIDSLRLLENPPRIVVVGSATDVAGRARAFWLGATDWVDESEGENLVSADFCSFAGFVPPRRTPRPSSSIRPSEGSRPGGMKLIAPREARFWRNSARRRQGGS